MLKLLKAQIETCKKNSAGTLEMYITNVETGFTLPIMGDRFQPVMEEGLQLASIKTDVEYKKIKNNNGNCSEYEIIDRLKSKIKKVTPPKPEPKKISLKEKLNKFINRYF